MHFLSDAHFHSSLLGGFTVAPTLKNGTRSFNRTSALNRMIRVLSIFGSVELKTFSVLFMSWKNLPLIGCVSEQLNYNSIVRRIYFSFKKSLENLFDTYSVWAQGEHNETLVVLNSNLMIPDLAFLNWDSQQGRDFAMPGSNKKNFNWANIILMLWGKSGIIKFEFKTT